MRDIFVEGVGPATSLVIKLTAISLFMLITGLLVFRWLKPRFSDQL